MGRVGLAACAEPNFSEYDAYPMAGSTASKTAVRTVVLSPAGT